MNYELVNNANTLAHSVFIKLKDAVMRAEVKRDYDMDLGQAKLYLQELEKILKKLKEGK